MHTQGRVQTVSSTLLAKQPVQANKETCATERTKLGAEDRGILAVSAEAAIATSRDALVSGRNAAWRMGDEHDSPTTMGMVKCMHALYAARHDGLRFSHLRCLLNTPEAKEGFWPAIGSF